MKLPEEIFLEICNNIKSEINNQEIEFKKDNGEKISTSIINYIKMHNYDGNYVYNGDIILYKGLEGYKVTMNYYFSNRRSCISINDLNMKVDDMAKYEFYLLKYIDKLFCTYKIDKFIDSLNN